MTSSDDTQASVEAFLKQAEIARQRQSWDDVIKIFQVALKQMPEERRFRHGLAQAYGAKADRAGFKPLFQRSVEEYWRLVNSDPLDVRAHDGLLAAAVRADQLPDVMEEYRARMNQQPDLEIYRETFKKIQTLYFLKAEPAKPVAAGSKFLHTAMARVAPLLSLALLIGWVILTFKIGPNRASANPKLLATSAALLRIGLFVLAGSLVYQGVRFFRTSK